MFQEFFINYFSKLIFTMVRVAVIDDNYLLREHIISRISGNFQIVFDSDSAIELLLYLEKCSEADLPEIILMDIEMDELDGIAATSKVKASYPSIKIAMLTVFADEEKVWDSVLAGADGYILKDETRDRLVTGMYDILNGGAYMSPSIARKAMKLLKGKAPEISKNDIESSLTRREFEILEMLSNGFSYREMADKLFISTATAKTHINNIYKKLQVNNKIQAINKLKSSPIRET
jgi:DNA-binding NarL/FixJ family response regulator